MSKVSRIVVVLSLVILAVLLISPVSAQIGKITPPPAGFAGFAVNSQAITLTWKNSLPDIEVRIERIPLVLATSRPTWTQVGVAFNTNSYTDSHLKCNIPYAYRARSFDPETKTYSRYTSPIVVTTDACVITPQQ